VWNAENQLIEVSENETTVATFEYDPFGRRVEKVVGATTTTYTYDHRNILRETAGASNAYYVHGPSIDEPLAKEVSGSATYYHVDALGSVLKVSDAAGDVVHQYRYDAYGKIESGASQGGYSFTGREWDPEVELYYYRARYYSSTIGRFISEDPIDWGGGPNFYSYVKSNPHNLRDPSGYAPKDRRFGLPDRFWDWYHRQVKQPGDPDINSRPEADEWFEEWKRQGEPDGEGSRRRDDKPIDVPPLPGPDVEPNSNLVPVA
jgi:RHS repeat-associated protein